MDQKTKTALAWARRHVDFSHLVRHELVGWLWPHEWRKLKLRMQREKPQHFKALNDAGLILPPVPVEPYERVRWRYVG